MADPWLDLDSAITDGPSVEGAVVASVRKNETTEAEAWMAQEEARLAPNEAAANQGGGVTPGKVAADVGEGVLEAPGQILGGARDAMQAILDGTAAMGEFLNENVADLGYLQVFNEKGELDPALVSKAKDEGLTLPEIGEADTVTGGMIRGVSQFLTGFGVAGKALGKIGTATKGARALRVVGQGMASDFAAFDAHEARLSDLIQTSPELANPVTEYLASDINDSELEGRLKNVAEGVLGDVVVAGLLTGLRSIKDARRLTASTGASSHADAAKILGDEAAGRPLREAEDITSVLGDPKGKALEVKAKAKIKDVETGVPDDVAARALTEKGLSKVDLGEREMFINFARITSPDDIKRLTADVADAMKPDIKKAQRGVRTNRKTMVAAGDENAWKLLVERRTGDTMNAEQSLALRQLWASSSEKLAQVSELAVEKPTPENLFAFRRMLAVQSAVQKEVLAVRTETARALQQWAIPVGGKTENLRDIQRVIDAYGGDKTTKMLAERVAALARTGNSAALDHLSRSSALAATTDVVREYWINALLSGPKTHLVNMMSNTSVAMLSVLERKAAEITGDLLGGVDRVQLGEAAAMMHGMTSSIRDAFRNAAKAFITGETGYGLNKIEGPRVRAIASESLGGTRNKSFNRVMNQPAVAKAIDVLGAVVTAPGRALGAEDEFFKTIGYRMELHTQAFRMARQEMEAGALKADGVKARMAEIIENPPENVRLAAADMAAYNTFTNPAGSFTKNVQSVRENLGLPGTFLLPFMNTPANIIKFTFVRTPLAPLAGAVRADILAGGARRDIALARIGIGSATMLTAYDLAMNGHLTGSGSDNWRENATLRRMGWQPSSVKVGDRYYAYNRLDPIGLQIGIAADLAEYILNGGDPNRDFEEVSMMSVLAAAQNMTDKSYLQGFSMFIEAMSEPGRYGERYFNRLAASFIPTGVSEIAKFIDPQLKATHDIVSSMKSRIPGMTKDLPARHDLWGRPIEFVSGLGPAFDAVSPVYSSQEDIQPIDAEMKRIGYFPQPPSRTLTIDGKKVSMRNNPKAHQRLIVLSGGTPASELPRQMLKSGKPSAASKRLDSFGDDTAMETLNKIVTGKHPAFPDYMDGSDDEKKRIIEKVLSDTYRDAARDQLLIEFPELAAAAR